MEPIQKWKYKTLQTLLSNHELDEELERHGEKGWEVIHFERGTKIFDPGFKRSYYILFKQKLN